MQLCCFESSILTSTSLSLLYSMCVTAPVPALPLLCSVTHKGLLLEAASPGSCPNWLPVELSWWQVQVGHWMEGRQKGAARVSPPVSASINCLSSRSSVLLSLHGTSLSLFLIFWVLWLHWAVVLLLPPFSLHSLRRQWLPGVANLWVTSCISSLWLWNKLPKI